MLPDAAEMPSWHRDAEALASYAPNDVLACDPLLEAVPFSLLASLWRQGSCSEAEKQLVQLACI